MLVQICIATEEKESGVKPPHSIKGEGRSTIAERPFLKRFEA